MSKQLTRLYAYLDKKLFGVKGKKVGMVGMLFQEKAAQTDRHNKKKVLCKSFLDSKVDKKKKELRDQHIEGTGFVRPEMKLKMQADSLMKLLFYQVEHNFGHFKESLKSNSLRMIKHGINLSLIWI